MSRLRRLAVPFVLLAALTAFALLETAHAAELSAVEQIPGMSCTASGGTATCAIQIAPGLRFEAPPANYQLTPDGLGFDAVNADQTLSVHFCSLPTGTGAPCLDTLRGTARVSVPQIGFLSSFLTPQPPLATVGLDSGANLAADNLGLSPDLLAMLQPDGQYMIFHTLSAGLEAQIPGLDFLTMSSGGSPTTLVIGTNGRFFYFEGELPGFPFDGKKQDSTSSGSTQSSSGSTSGSSGTASSTSGTSATGTSSTSGTTSSSTTTDTTAPSTSTQDPQTSQDASGPHVAVAFDQDGNIPFVPLQTTGVAATLRPFQGNLYVRGPIPVNPLMELDGTVVVNLDPAGDGDTPFDPAFYTSPDLEVGGNGTLAVKLPFFGISFPNLGLDLGQASVEANVSSTQGGAAFSGLVTTQDFLTGLPVPIRPDGTLEAYGSLSSQDLTGSYVHIEGQLSVNASVLGQALGLPLGDLAAGDAVMDINSAGLVLRGTTSSQVSPSISYGGDVALTVTVSPSGAWSIELRGDMTVAGEQLKDATLRISNQGMLVNGVLYTDHYQFAMLGGFAAGGYSISGSTTIADPIALNNQARDAAAAALAAQQQTLTSLQKKLAGASQTLAGAQTAVNNASAAVSTAQAAVNSLQSQINTTSSRRSSVYNSYRYWVRVSCHWYDASCQARRAYDISYYYGKYSYYSSVLAGLNASMTVARGTLSAAQATLAAAQSALAQAQASVQSLQQQVAQVQEAVTLAGQELAALPDVSGSIVPTVTLTLQNGVASGRVDATWNGQALTGGRVVLGHPGEACVTIPNAGELCSPL